MKHSIYILFTILFFLPEILFAQEEGETDAYNWGGMITLDSLVVTAQRSGFSVDDFVELVRDDESFYLAFRNLRFLNYQAVNQIQMLNKKDELIAEYSSATAQHSDGRCRNVEVLAESSEGKFYKRKNKYRYYTAKLYDRLFFTEGEVCESRNVVHAEPEGKMEGHIANLKKLIFNPGEKVDVPLIGNKTAIFSEKMAKYYDYEIQSKLYEDEIDCYVFTVKVKPEYVRKKDKTVIKYLETYFDKTTFQVIARKYQLAYSGALFDFDVTMNIKLIKLDNQYVPEFLEYDGFWDIPARKPEYSKFSCQFHDFSVP